MRGPNDWFTGTVGIDPLFEAPEPARVRGASVTFDPGARTAWHTHPLGQTLIVTSGRGWAQRWGGSIGRLSRLLHGPTPRTSRLAGNTHVRWRVPFPLNF
jgi:hypothetical protein